MRYKGGGEGEGAKAGVSFGTRAGAGTGGEGGAGAGAVVYHHCCSSTINLRFLFTSLALKKN